MRIILYTGKGGVGKTSVSAATAVRAAQRGYRTIVMSTDLAHSLADSLDVKLAPEPVEIAPNLWAQETEKLNVPFSTANTAILVASSFACQWGVFAAERGQVGRTGKLFNFTKWGLREWFVLTYVMGSFFIAGQVLEYAELVHENVTIPSSAYGSIFYLTTGFHGLHVTGGLIAFLFVLGRTYMARTFTHEQAVTAIVVSYYWHFVDVVWIALFATIYLLQ